MLQTRTQRLFLISLILGVTSFSIGLYQWLQPYRHHWVLSTQYIPEYPLDYMGASREDDGLIQRHRACEWTSGEHPEYAQMNSEASKSVVVYDQLLTVDNDCAKKQIAHLEPTALHYAVGVTSSGAANPYWNAKLATKFWDYENLVLFRGISGTPYFGGEEPKSGRDYYKNALKNELQKTGYGVATANAIAEQCARAEQRWCVEKNRLTHVHVWRIVSSDLTMSVGAFLLLLGIAGTLLSKPISWVWLHTGNAVIQWVKRGK